MARGKTYWMVASSLKNFNITKDMGFKSQGLMSKQRRKAQRMEPGDRLVFYITGTRKLTYTSQSRPRILGTRNGQNLV